VLVDASTVAASAIKLRTALNPVILLATTVEKKDMFLATAPPNRSPSPATSVTKLDTSLVTAPMTRRTRAEVVEAEGTPETTETEEGKVEREEKAAVAVAETAPLNVIAVARLDI